MRDGIVLVVDDEPMVEDMINEILARSGCRTVSFTDPLEALCFFEDHHRIIDLVITDLKMPRIEGSELTRKMAHLYPEIPVVIITGFVNALRERDSSPNVRAVLEKPISRDMLVRTVATLLAHVDHAAGTCP